MADGIPGPLDGILEEAAKTQEEVRQNNHASAFSTDLPGPSGDDGVQPPRRIREVYPADIEKLNARIKNLEAMILAMRGLVAASMVGVMYAIFKIRKLEKGQAALPPSQPIEVEATVASERPAVEAVKVGD
jgi:hypothetical protein